MALLWFDGFESYTAVADIIVAGISSPFTQVASGAIGIGAYGRRSSRGIYTQESQYLTYYLASNYVTLYFGMAVKLSSGTLSAYTNSTVLINNRSLVGFGADGYAHITLMPISASSEFDVYNGTTYLGTTSGFGMVTGVWLYVEVMVTIDDSAGAVIVKVNGNEVLNLSNVDTKDNTGGAYVNQIKVGGTQNIVLFSDDLYICDATGDAPHNGFLGDVRVDVLRPDGEGTYKTDFAGSPDVSSNLNVDETSGPDDDTTYNYGSDVGDKDTYTLGALPAPSSTTIYGVKSQITVKKTDAGSREVKVLTRAGTTDDLSATVSLSDSYTTAVKIYEDNPDDAAAWEDADVNAMEVGVEIVT